MPRLAWLTDLHLNFLAPPQRRHFYGTLPAADALLISGDTGEANSVQHYLAEIEEAFPVPIYFVLGNHDFYGGSIAAVRSLVGQQARGARYLRWLTTAGVVPLNDTTALIGHDGWADGRLGSGPFSSVLLSDFFVIQELSGLEKPQLFRRLNALGDEAAEHLAAALAEALHSFSSVIVLTHVPPFAEACWHEGRISSDDYLPHFASQAAGEVLLEAAQRHPACQIQVLCGHTHSPGFAQISDNLAVHTGGAQYGQPALQRIFEVV